MTKFAEKSFSVGGYSKPFTESFAKVFGKQPAPEACTSCGGQGCGECLGTGKASWQPGGRSR